MARPWGVYTEWSDNRTNPIVLKHRFERLEGALDLAEQVAKSYVLEGRGVMRAEEYGFSVYVHGGIYRLIATTVMDPDMQGQIVR